MSARRRKAAWLSRQFVYPQILSNLPQALQNSLPSSAPLFQTDEPRYFLLKFQKLRTAPARASFLFATFDVLRSPRAASSRRARIIPQVHKGSKRRASNLSCASLLAELVPRSGCRTLRLKSISRTVSSSITQRLCSASISTSEVSTGAVRASKSSAHV